MMNMKGKLWKICNFCLLSFCSLLLALFSTTSDVSAVSLAPDVWQVTFASRPQFSPRIYTVGGSEEWQAFQGGIYTTPKSNSTVYLNGFAFKGNKNSSLADGFTYQARDFFAVTFTVGGSFEFDQVFNYTGSHQLELIQIEELARSTFDGHTVITYQAIGQVWSSGSSYLELYPNSLKNAYGESFTFSVNSVSQWRYQNTTVNVDVDTGSVVNAIKESHTLQQANTQAINEAKELAHADAQAQKEAIDNQTKQQQDQYDQEKQEEQDRENQGNEDMNEATGIFNFNILNPFAGIWDLFKPNQCVDIPIVAEFVGSEETQYCSWFPQSVRSILTPAFGIGSIMILFGFIVRWLNSSHADGTIDNGWNADFYSKGGNGLNG